MDAVILASLTKTFDLVNLTVSSPFDHSDYCAHLTLFALFLSVCFFRLIHPFHSFSPLPSLHVFPATVHNYFFPLCFCDFTCSTRENISATLYSAFVSRFSLYLHCLFCLTIQPISLISTTSPISLFPAHSSRDAYFTLFALSHTCTPLTYCDGFPYLTHSFHSLSLFRHTPFSTFPFYRTFQSLSALLPLSLFSNHQFQPSQSFHRSHSFTPLICAREGWRSHALRLLLGFKQHLFGFTQLFHHFPPLYLFFRLSEVCESSAPLSTK
ncbi:uncharacterized protein BDZ83DRAFT_643475 [Colletotrichum acutatum]|uniref:Uncharacterized protein n=1 Tax=Glomerella acutata TaxID=27357 RepID=A0AAD8U5T8_GLOAC|nr:uncharacterized protein BDZ83DRAFT_643475 [Colletotrichum acutatum]KAK1706627.1 hypothetical protein BDZ83DRAFT_643475 [Colletotrichum acutatum]